MKFRSYLFNLRLLNELQIHMTKKLKKEDYFNKVKNSENASKKAKHNQNDFDENIFDVILR